VPNEKAIIGGLPFGIRRIEAKGTKGKPFVHKSVPTYGKPEPPEPKKIKLSNPLKPPIPKQRFDLINPRPGQVKYQPALPNYIPNRDRHKIPIQRR
jgi:hypothetical protein